MGEVDPTNVFINGTKVESAANRYIFVWRKGVMKNEQGIEFVSGRGKKKTQLQKDIELFESYLIR